LGVTVYYMVINQPWVRIYLGLTQDGLWWGVQPISAGVFGVASGVVTTVVLTLVTRPHANASECADAGDTAV
jgi:cation/acetate symporter